MKQDREPRQPTAVAGRNDRILQGTPSQVSSVKSRPEIRGYNSRPRWCTRPPGKRKEGVDAERDERQLLHHGEQKIACWASCWLASSGFFQIDSPKLSRLHHLLILVPIWEMFLGSHSDN